jgi:hypothetical protein
VHTKVAGVAAYECLGDEVGYRTDTGLERGPVIDVRGSELGDFEILGRAVVVRQLRRVLIGVHDHVNVVEAHVVLVTGQRARRWVVR